MKWELVKLKDRVNNENGSQKENFKYLTQLTYKPWEYGIWQDYEKKDDNHKCDQCESIKGHFFQVRFIFKDTTKTCISLLKQNYYNDLKFAESFCNSNYRIISILDKNYNHNRKQFNLDYNDQIEKIALNVTIDNLIDFVNLKGKKTYCQKCYFQLSKFGYVLCRECKNIYHPDYYNLCYHCRKPITNPYKILKCENCNEVNITDTDTINCSYCGNELMNVEVEDIPSNIFGDIKFSL